MGLLDLLLTGRCAGCDTVGPSPCEACVDRLVPLEEIEVELVRRCLVVVEHDELSSRLIAALKYRGVTTGLDWFVRALALRARSAEVSPGVITWVPATPDHRRRRGFDQAQLLARALAVRLDLPCACLLHRRQTAAQTGRTRVERLVGPQLRASRGVRSWHGHPVLVVDDVVTTGASLTAAARTLRGAGVSIVDAAALTHRRPPGCPSSR